MPKKKQPEAAAEETIVFDLAAALGATPETSGQVLTLYIPNKDRHGHEFGTQRKWTLEAAEILAAIGGGVTIMPPTEGGWVNDEDKTIWEDPVLVYSYIKPDRFLAELPRLREFLHRMGRETNQGEVVVSFEGRFYRVRTFDRS